jgi:hypothetical protein
MPTIIETRPIDMSIGPVHVTGLLFVATPPEETFVEGEIEVLGLIQETFRMVTTEEMMSVDLTIHEAFYTFSMHFDIPSGSFLCQLQLKDAETEEEWHVLATLPA